MVINDSNVLSIESPNFKIQTFTIIYEKNISNKGKNILQSFKIKPYYYVIDDILYLLKSIPTERNYFLQLFTLINLPIYFCLTQVNGVYDTNTLIIANCIQNI